MDINLIENWSLIFAVGGIIATYARLSYRVGQLEKKIIHLDSIEKTQSKSDIEFVKLESLIRELKSSIDGMIRLQNRENEVMRDAIEELKKN